MTRIETDRLVLRSWRDEDRAPFHALNNDPVVMATLGPPMLRAESDALIDRLIDAEERGGCTFWAVERRGDGMFLGFCGVRWNEQPIPIAGELESGWRLVSAAWGQGYAREGAEASLGWAWANTVAPHVVAITAEVNARSWGLMERLGMVRDSQGDFDHPFVAEGDRLRRHRTYRITRPGAAA